MSDLIAKVLCFVLSLAFSIAAWAFVDADQYILAVVCTFLMVFCMEGYV